MLSRLVNRLPRPLVRSGRWSYLLLRDLWDRVRGRTAPLRPPRSLHHVGSGDFEVIGRQFFSLFRDLCFLEPDEAVLDIGSGAGRMAVPLLGYLNQEGSYTGFDVARKAVHWCRENITVRNRRFVFHWSDVYNREYNPGARMPCTEFRFPGEDESIDFAFSISVFTHLVAGDVRHYLGEMRRVLRPGGRALATFYILVDEQAGDALSPAAFDFDFALGDCFTIDPKTPERAVAYREGVLREMVEKAGLEVREPIYFGYWSGHASGLTAQDVVVLDKPATE